MSYSAPELASILATIAEHAPALRRAGITYVQAGDVRVSLCLEGHDEAEDIYLDNASQADKAEPLDVLNDPATYGRTSGVPGFTRPSQEIPEEE